MLGRIVFLGDNEAQVKLNDNINLMTNLMNIHVVLEDGQKKILGEITSINGNVIKIAMLGEFSGNSFFTGVMRKPTLNAVTRFITKEELDIVIGNRTQNSILLGKSPLYNNYPIYTDINTFFSNHFAIFGNSGSGKSCGLAKIIQNLFADKQNPPYRSNFLIFDSYGEYRNAFAKIGDINPNFGFKYYTTNTADANGIPLRIPLWTLTVNDLARLLFATEHSQLTFLEETVRLTKLFVNNSDESKAYKNHLIAKAIISILYNSHSSSSKRNDVFNILDVCSTDELNLNVQVSGLGYSRIFRDLFTIDSNGNFPERNLLIEYVTSFVNDDIEKITVNYNQKYTLNDLEKALNFVMISEGVANNQKAYNSAVSLKVRLHSIIVSDYAKYFEYPEYVTKEEYINNLIIKDGRKVQIINFNFEDVDDWFSKGITKYFTNLIFNYSKSLGNKSNMPFNLILEEAHHYINEDNDRYLFGYNIFERVAKEGRKYGVIMGILSQRPVEMSETVISQVSNFLIFKMTHPLDVEYIKKMLPNINEEVVEKQKNLQTGTCVAFGRSFRIPMFINFDMPNPAPFSSNFDMVESWKM